MSLPHSLFPIIAIAASAPFLSGLEPGTDAPVQAQPTTAPVTAPPPSVTPLALDPRTAGAALKQTAATRSTPAVNSALSNVVAEAIKRKLDRVAATKTGGGVEVPASPSDSTAFTAAPTMVPFTPSAAPAEGPTGGSPEPSMMSNGARVMMGSPTDGSPSYVRVNSSPKSDAARPDSVAAQNPLAPSTDPMETGGSTGSHAAASEPGPQHTLLDIFVGTWDVSANFDTGPGQPPETASGQMVNAWQLDGRWLKQEYSGQMASLGSFRGIGFLGYDNLQKMYVGTWMDTLSTSCFVSKGSFDDSKATFELSGDFTVEGGEKFKQKQVMTVLSPDRYVVTMYLTGPDGVEFKTGNLEYTRSVRKVSVAPTPTVK